jgi:hypothetical protein
MEKLITFTNIEYNNNYISADLYMNNKFIVRLLVDSIQHLRCSANTDIGLYEYFRVAMLENIENFGIFKIENQTIH